MSMTDPIADMLARIRNAQGAEHDTVEMPLSKVKVEIARILKSEGYIADYKTTMGDSGHPALSVRLKYGQGRARTISGIKRHRELLRHLSQSCQARPCNRFLVSFSVGLSPGA